MRKSFGAKGLLATVLLLLFTGILVVPVASAENGQGERQKIVQQVAERWIQVGLEQYERGLYKASEQSFLRAKDYESYLPADQRLRLSELLQKAHTAVVEIQQIEGDMQAADALLAQGRNAEARAILQTIKNSRFLSEQQRKTVEEKLAKASVDMGPQQAAMAQLYNQSVDYYNAGNIERAREGFLEVARSGLAVAQAGKRAEDYLAKIDAQLAEQMPQAEPETTMPNEVEQELFGAADEAAKAAEPVQPAKKPVPEQPRLQTPPAVTEQKAEGGYIDLVQRRQNILRSHTKAVVNDALAKARSLVNENEFDQARKAVDYAQNIVNNNRLHLGEQLFEQYSKELQRQRQEIDAAQQKREKELAEQKRIEAAKQQLRVRTQMEADRQKRISELMQNARAYQKQQRYEEALGQLHSLISIDPLNNEALILKDTLEDTIGFRKQLQLQQEKQKERHQLLLETGRSEIPYAQEFTLPKDWREISASPYRAPEDAIGRDPETARVYEQLEQVVDLSELNQDMPLGEAIELLRESVDPPLRIFVNWRDLYDNADIDSTTPIDMDPISAIKLGSALRLLLEAVSGGFAELDYGVENGVITIATQESLPSELITLVYDVTDLVQSPAEYRVQVSGGAGGGGGGVSDIGGGFEDEGEEDYSREELRQQMIERMDALILLVQDTVMPDSWFDVGGEGTITSYGAKLLSVRQTAETHNQINELFTELRKAHGYQVAIEARFLTVQENFLEEIGLDVDLVLYPEGKGKWDPIEFGQDSTSIAVSAGTGVAGTFGGTTVDGPAASLLTGGYGSIMDDLQVRFLLTATQARQDSTIVTAPKATVLSGESASFRVERYLYYAGDIETETTEIVQGQGSINFQYEDRSVRSGTILNITPTITPDKKHVLLNIDATLSDFLGFRRQRIEILGLGEVDGETGGYGIDFPEVEVSQIRTRVSVPDKGTLLLGGQKIGAEVEREAGVPILSKIPILGRAFRNTSEVKDHKILLILVKPTIILQEEAEAEAMASFENSF